MTLEERRVSLFGLAPCGVCKADPLPDRWCALTAPFHPYLNSFEPTAVCFLLHFPSLTGPRTTGHIALWSSDFPLRAQDPKRSPVYLRIQCVTSQTRIPSYSLTR